MSDTDEATAIHTTIISRLDNSGGLMDALSNALHAADEDGFFMESDRDRAASADAALQQAFEAAEDTDPDPEEVKTHVSDARTFITRLRQGLGHDVRPYPLPDRIDSGVYETLGGFVLYVEDYLTDLEKTAEQWVYVTS